MPIIWASSLVRSYRSRQDCATRVATITAWVHFCTGRGNTATLVGSVQGEGLCFWCRGYHYQPDLWLLPKAFWWGEWRSVVPHPNFVALGQLNTSELWLPLGAVCCASWLLAFSGLIILLFQPNQLIPATLLCPLKLICVMFSWPICSLTMVCFFFFLITKATQQCADSQGIWGPFHAPCHSQVSDIIEYWNGLLKNQFKYIFDS